MNTNLYTLSLFIIFQTTTCTLTVARLFHVLRRSQKQHLVSYNHHPSEFNTGNVQCLECTKSHQGAVLVTRAYTFNYTVISTRAAMAYLFV